jgi:hypothetical protein
MELLGLYNVIKITGAALYVVSTIPSSARTCRSFKEGISGGRGGMESSSYDA